MINNNTPGLVLVINQVFQTTLVASIIPLRILLFTLHNYLTKRDYSYSIDDLCDLGLATCICVWVYYYFLYI